MFDALLEFAGECTFDFLFSFIGERGARSLSGWLDKAPEKQPEN
jgi:hypothetical protein